MNNKVIITLAIITFILTTLLIVLTKPELHNPVVLSPIQPVIETLPEKISETEQEPQIIHVEQYEETPDNIALSPKTNQTSTKQQVKIKDTPIQTVQKQTIVQKKTNTQSKKPVKTEKTATPQNKYELPKSIQDIVNNKQSNSEIISHHQQEQNTPKAEEKHSTQHKPKPVSQTQVTSPKPVQTNAPLTEAEEIIVWNKWRSDLQNKVMRDSRIAAPRGTVFRFSFTVNKFGQISNLKVWSDTPGYTNYAIQALKPLLLSYQGQPILNFPSRTKRITTNVIGGFVVSTQDRYTTPSDYSDIERIKN